MLTGSDGIQFQNSSSRAADAVPEQRSIEQSSDRSGEAVHMSRVGEVFSSVEPGRQLPIDRLTCDLVVARSTCHAISFRFSHKFIKLVKDVILPSPIDAHLIYKIAVAPVVRNGEKSVVSAFKL